MINTQMRDYDYFTFGELDAYGQPQLSEKPVGKVKMCINISSTSVQDNINYKDCSYTGLTYALAPLDDTCVIKYGDELLKIQNINPMGRLKQVFLSGYKV